MIEAKENANKVPDSDPDEVSGGSGQDYDQEYYDQLQREVENYSIPGPERKQGR